MQGNMGAACTFECAGSADGALLVDTTTSLFHKAAVDAVVPLGDTTALLVMRQGVWGVMLVLSTVEVLCVAVLLGCIAGSTAIHRC